MAPLTAGVHHAGLTVPDLAAATAFFIDVLGFSKVGADESYPAVFVSDNSTMITLWQAATGAAPHDRRGAIGLHHLALKVAGGDVALDALEATLRAAAGVEVDFGAEELKGFGVRHMMVTAVGVRIEFIAA
ncbi:hypothetical protein MMPV_006592 [Pyropia vietnamensis]